MSGKRHALGGFYFLKANKLTFGYTEVPECVCI